EGKLRAVLPLIEDQGALSGFPVRRLRYPANTHVSRADLIHGAFDAGRAANMLWQHLKSIPRWDVLEIGYVPESGAAENIIHLAKGENWPTGHWECNRSPFVTLSEESGTQGSTRAKFRANLRRRSRKLEAMGAVSLRVVEEADPALLQAFYDLEKAGWKGE